MTGKKMILVSLIVVTLGATVIVTGTASLTCVSSDAMLRLTGGGCGTCYYTEDCRTCLEYWPGTYVACSNFAKYYECRNGPDGYDCGTCTKWKEDFCGAYFSCPTSACNLYECTKSDSCTACDAWSGDACPGEE